MAATKSGRSNHCHSVGNSVPHSAGIEHPLPVQARRHTKVLPPFSMNKIIEDHSRDTFIQNCQGYGGSVPRECPQRAIRLASM